jgi:hypothetical protein
MFKNFTGNIEERVVDDNKNTLISTSVYSNFNKFKDGS